MRRTVFQVYPSPDGYRWRAVASNGKIIAQGTQGYSRRVDIKRMLRKRFMRPFDQLVDVDQ